MSQGKDSAIESLIDAAEAAADYAHKVFEARADLSRGTGGVAEAVQALDVATRTLQFVVASPGATPSRAAAILARIYGKQESK